MTTSTTGALLSRMLAPPGADFTTSTAWVRLGMRAVVALLVGLLGFGMLVSINGAVVTGGTVTVESNYKTVQHLDGGIVAKIRVRNGDPVRAGDVLVELDDTAVRANLAVVESRITDYRIQQVRLEAERDRRTSFALPKGTLKEPVDADAARVLAAQTALFEARLQSRLGEQSVLSQRVEQLGAEHAGLKAQLGARERERKLNGKELAAVRGLFEKGFANQQRLSTLEREAARLDGEIGRLRSEVARAAGGISEAELKRAQSEKTFTESVVDELRKVQAQLGELDESRKTLSDKVARATIRAPRSGRVHALAIHTEGGVVTPATPIMQIVPEGERLIVEAHVAPQDVDKVRTGQDASLRFPAFDARSTPRLEGKVAQVSAAQLTDPQGKSYFTAQIEIAASEIARIGAGHRLLPGMPAEVYIETKARSIMSYFLKPLTDAMFRIFRER
ncbi:MAG: HlyD family type I secretion periplasmic adaptor subunit [Hyphomicrobiaceae bacterium]